MYILQCERDADFGYAIIESIGFLIHEDTKKYVIAGDLVDQDVRRAIVIPKENVISVRSIS